MPTEEQYYQQDAKQMLEIKHYWQSIAPTNLNAIELIDKLLLNVSRHCVSCDDVLVYPIRRLVLFGLDTPENIALLFGPMSDTLSLRSLHQSIRCQTLHEQALNRQGFALPNALD